MQKIRLDELPARPAGRLRRILSPSARHQTGPETAPSGPIIHLTEARPPRGDPPTLEQALMARIDGGLRRVERTAARLMNEIAAEVWRAVGPEAGERQEERVLAVLARDQALKGSIAHADERFQAIDLRIGRIEQALQALSGAVRAMPEQLRGDLGSVRADLAEDVARVATGTEARLAGSAATFARSAEHLRAGMRELATGRATRDGEALQRVERVERAAEDLGHRADKGLSRIERTAAEVGMQLKEAISGLDARLAELDRSVGERIERGEAAVSERLSGALEIVARRAEASIEATGSRADAAFNRALRRLDAGMAAAARRTNELLADGVQRLEASRNETADAVGAAVAAAQARTGEAVRAALERTARIELQVSSLAARAKELPSSDRLDTALVSMSDRIADLDRAIAGLAGRDEREDRNVAERLESATATFVERFESLAEALGQSVAGNAEGLARLERRLARERAEAEQAERDHRDDAIAALRRDMRRQQFAMRDALLEISRRMDGQAEALRERMAGLGDALESMRREARAARPVLEAHPPIAAGTGRARDRAPDPLAGVDAGFFGGPVPD